MAADHGGSRFEVSKLHEIGFINFELCIWKVRQILDQETSNLFAMIAMDQCYSTNYPILVQDQINNPPKQCKAKHDC